MDGDGAEKRAAGDVVHRTCLIGTIAIFATLYYGLCTNTDVRTYVELDEKVQKVEKRLSNIEQKLDLLETQLGERLDGIEEQLAAAAAAREETSDLDNGTGSAVTEPTATSQSDSQSDSTDNQSTDGEDDTGKDTTTPNVTRVSNSTSSSSATTTLNTGRASQTTTPSPEPEPSNRRQPGEQSGEGRKRTSRGKSSSKRTNR